MPSQCSVPMCGTVGGHKFPKDKIRRNKWVEAIRNEYGYFKPSIHSIVCKNHFLPEDYVKEPFKNIYTPYLKKDVVPSQFIWNNVENSNNVCDSRLEKVITNHRKWKTTNHRKGKTYSNKAKMSKTAQDDTDGKENKTQDNTPKTETTLESEDADCVETEKTNELKEKEEVNKAVHRIDPNELTEESCDLISECRACLQQMQPDGLFSLFQGWAPAWQGLGSTIAEDLVNLADVQLSETDKHSNYICYTCCEKLWHACHFKLLVKNNDTILRQRYSEEHEKVWPKPIQVDKNLNGLIESSYSCVDIKQEVVSDDELGHSDDVTDAHNILDIKVEPEEMVQQAPIVYNGVTSPNEFPVAESAKTEPTVKGEANTELSLLREIKEESISDPEELELSLDCLLCARSFHSVTGLKAHVIANHSYQTVGRNNEDSQRTSVKYVCAICRRPFATSTDLMVHETCHNKHACYACSAKFETFARLSEHRQRCKALASAELKRPKTLDDVIRPQIEDKQLKDRDPSEINSTNKGGESFQRDLSLEINNDINEETKDSQISCPQCSEVFKDPYYVKIHQEIHHSKEPADWQIEDKVPLLEAEAHLYTEETPQIEDKQLKDRDPSEINSTNEEEGESFQRDMSLEINNDINEETKDSQISCLQCNEVFKDPCYVKIHQKIHHSKEPAEWQKEDKVPLLEAEAHVYTEET